MDAKRPDLFKDLRDQSSKYLSDFARDLREFVRFDKDMTDAQREERTRIRASCQKTN